MTHNEHPHPGRELKMMRELARLTQREISELSGYTIEHVSRVENERVTPSARYCVTVFRLIAPRLMARYSRYTPKTKGQI